VRAIRVLEALGKRAKAAEPALLEALQDRATSGPAVRALCSLGPRASTLEAIIQAGWGKLQPGHGQDVLVVAYHAGEGRSRPIRRAFRDAVRPLVAECDPAILKALGSEDARVRRVVSASLEENVILIKKPSKRLLGALKQAIEDPDGRVRAKA